MSSAPPAKPKRRTRAEIMRTITIGDWYLRLADQTPCQVKNVYRGDARIQLVADTGGKPFTVTLDDLLREYDRREP